jgi:hypothetical protein
MRTFSLYLTEGLLSCLLTLRVLFCFFFVRNTQWLFSHDFVGVHQLLLLVGGGMGAEGTSFKN